MQHQIRQGDVALVPRQPLSADERAKATPVARDQGRVVLAYGEVTGHAHAIHAPGVEQVEFEGGARVLRVDAVSQALLQHEEHAAISIPPGDYSVIRQREYTPEAVRNVAD